MCLRWRLMNDSSCWQLGCTVGNVGTRVLRQCDHVFIGSFLYYPTCNDAHYRIRLWSVFKGRWDLLRWNSAVFFTYWFDLIKVFCSQMAIHTLIGFLNRELKSPGKSETGIFLFSVTSSLQNKWVKRWVCPVRAGPSDTRWNPEVLTSQFLLTLQFLCRSDLFLSRVCLQGADQHVNTGANIHTAAPERRGTWG